jgi:mutator protein MutT
MSDYVMELRALVGTRPLILVGASVIVLNDREQILLQHRVDNGLWGLPGGNMEPGETLEEVARRETAQEVGVTCGALQLLQVHSGPELYYRYPHGDEVYNVAAVYLCREFAGEPTPADAREVREVRWFDLGALPADICPPDRVAIEAFVSHYAGRS